MSDKLIFSLHCAQLFCCVLGILWLSIGHRKKVDSSYAFYEKIMRVYLPGSILVYAAIVISAIIERHEQGSVRLFFAPVCLATMVIAILLLRMLRLLKRFRFYDRLLDKAKERAAQSQSLEENRDVSAPGISPISDQAPTDTPKDEDANP
jgi:hypothetical protein